MRRQCAISKIVFIQISYYQEAVDIHIFLHKYDIHAMSSTIRILFCKVIGKHSHRRTNSKDNARPDNLITSVTLLLESVEFSMVTLTTRAATASYNKGMFI